MPVPGSSSPSNSTAALAVLCGVAGAGLAWCMLKGMEGGSHNNTAADTTSSAPSKCPFSFMMGGSESACRNNRCPVSGSAAAEPDADGAIDLDAGIREAGGEVGCICKRYTFDELSELTGHEGRRVCVGLKGVVYSLTRQFYGPNEPYCVYAGKDVTLPLAVSEVSATLTNIANWRDYVVAINDNENDSETNASSVKPPTSAFSGSGAEKAGGGDGAVDIAGSTASREERLLTLRVSREDMHMLDLWEKKYRKKYLVVGWVAEMEKANKDSTATDCAPPVNADGSYTFKDYLEMEAFVRAQVELESHEGVS